MASTTQIQFQFQFVEDENSEQQQHPPTELHDPLTAFPPQSNAISLSSSPFAACSLSTYLPSNFTLRRLNIPSLSTPPQFTNVKVPTQASSISNSLCSVTATPLRPSSRKSTITFQNPIQLPLSLGPLRPLGPSNGAVFRRSCIVWFRSDLRVHDNECLTAAHNESVSVLPVYCFDPRDYGKSSSGFDKTGPYRAAFLLNCVSDLRRNLQSRGSDLIVRFGKPEQVLVEMAKAIGADAIYTHREVSHDEVKSEETTEATMKEEGVEVKYFWGSTLFHVDDLPFKVEDMPTSYGVFKEKVKGLDVRKTIDALDQLKGVPKRGDVEPGEIPSLADLGFSPNAAMPQDGKSMARTSLVGGETEALEKLKKYASESQATQKKGSVNSIYGANFSCKISPWLTSGCISPRAIFHELKNAASGAFSATSEHNGGGGSSSSSSTGLNWLTYELMWRDFFRFITCKYSSEKKQLSAAPATAFTGALAS